jgi:iron-sulfur cluster repair protein YtfE (RIC family)
MDGTVGQQLEHDHHRIDEGFARFSQSLAGSAIDRASYDDAARALRHHIFVEEVLHFPVLRAAGLLAPVLVMLREHGEIWDLLDALTAALDGDDDAAARKFWPQLATVLEQHNLKEERILYPAGDQKLSPGDAELIVSTLAAGETPTGWRCEMAGQAATGSPAEQA